MTETFTWCPSIQSQGTKQYRVIRVQFGDGYSQAISEGINNIVQTWPLNFKGREEKIQEIINFLHKHQGFRSFLWTPPMGEQGLYRTAADSFKLTPLGAGLYSLDITFEQIFHP